MPIAVTASASKVRLLVSLMMLLVAPAAEARKVPFVTVRLPPKFKLASGVMTSLARTAPAARLAPVPLTKVTVVAEVMSRIYQFCEAGRLALVTFWPGTRPAVLVSVMTGLAVPVLTAVLVNAASEPRASTTAATSAAVLAARLSDKMRVVESKIWAMVAPTGIPVPEIGCPTCNKVVLPEARTTVVVAVVPVAARLKVAADP